jgi:hypothetical protein
MDFPLSCNSWLYIVVNCVFNSAICSPVNSVSSVEDVSSVYSVSSDYSDEVYKNFNNTKNTTLVNESNITENINRNKFY